MESALDLEPVPGAPHASAAPATSAITQERAGAGPLSWRFSAATIALMALAAGTAWLLGSDGTAVTSETNAEPLAFGLAEHGLGLARALSAVAVALTVGGVAVAGRSITRSGIAGLLAATLVAADPSVLAYGRLALPVAFVFAGAAVALAAFTLPRVWAPWVGGAALAVACAADPRVLGWGVILGAFALLRGHIYASPRHLAMAGVQAVGLPLLGAIAHVVVDGSTASLPTCLVPMLGDALTLRAAVQPGAGLLAQPNPVTWLVGLGALAFLGFGCLGFAGSRFRLARANGRLQARLVAPFPAPFGRGLWLLLLLIATPLPQLWILPAALALAIGIQDLGEDAPGFGLALAIVALAFAVVVLVRSWGALTGNDPSGVTDALDLVPWAKSVSC